VDSLWGWGGPGGRSLGDGPDGGGKCPAGGGSFEGGVPAPSSGGGSGE